MTWSKWRYVSMWVVLLGVGGAQMAFDALGMRTAKGLALATGMSPAPRVFSAASGLETFSSTFALQWSDAEGHIHHLPLDTEVYRNIRGPYKRRNVYGAVLSYGPILQRDVPDFFEQVATFALCGERPLMQELTGMHELDIAGPVTIHVYPREGSDTGDLPLQLKVSCP